MDLDHLSADLTWENRKIHAFVHGNFPKSKKLLIIKGIRNDRNRGFLPKIPDSLT